MKRWILGVSLLACAALAQAEDVDSIDKLVFKGDVLKLRLTTEAAPYKLDLEKTNWSDADCKVTTTRLGRQLIFQVDLGKRLDSKCRLAIRGNVKPGKQVETDMAVLDASLKGQFDQVQIKAKALDALLKGNFQGVKLTGEAVKGDVNGSVSELRLKGQAVTLDFEGKAKALDVDGQALKTDIKLLGAQPDANVSVKGQMVKLDFSASKQAKLEYQVSGEASKVSSDWTSTPGAPLKLTVRGQAVKVSLDQD
ncbi:hypothetical protein [Chromobacterium sp. IIBBL 290-4]|uniref:hypothetical protein n=1 Tax=Chromobacterium sp. IIBBL 290-4 TaxID=2953890 RepID=UPI0020B6B2C9|nr:hypothetical protein [Chromobacterium sp. IIBBL 290-4]UTH72319.1 hypothetical protein NKT35_12205 [Chromobacterium sp. IIBBL 290-4]